MNGLVRHKRSSYLEQQLLDSPKDTKLQSQLQDNKKIKVTLIKGKILGIEMS